MEQVPAFPVPYFDLFLKFFRFPLYLRTYLVQHFPCNLATREIPLKRNTSEEEYMPSLISSEKIKARHCHSTKHLILIDDICTINDRGEFERSIYVIYSKELKPKVEDQGDHVTFFG